MITILLARVGKETRTRASLCVDADLLAVVADNRVAVALEDSPTHTVAVEFSLSSVLQRSDKLIDSKWNRAETGLPLHCVRIIVEHRIVRVNAGKRDVLKRQQQLRVSEGLPSRTGSIIVQRTIVERVKR